MYWIKSAGSGRRTKGGAIPFCFSSCVAVVLPSKGDLVAAVKGHHFRVMSSSNGISCFEFYVGQHFVLERCTVRDVNSVVCDAYPVMPISFYIPGFWIKEEGRGERNRERGRVGTKNHGTFISALEIFGGDAIDGFVKPGGVFGVVDSCPEIQNVVHVVLVQAAAASSRAFIVVRGVACPKSSKVDEE